MEKEKIKRPKIERERIMISINRRILEEMDKQGLIKYRFWDLFGEEKQDD